MAQPLSMPSCGVCSSSISPGWKTTKWFGVPNELLNPSEKVAFTVRLFSLLSVS